MKKIFIICLLSILSVYGQKYQLSNVTRILADYKFSMVKVSPDGEYIAAGGENNTGLFLFNTNGDLISTLSDKLGAGWGFTWSKNSDKIAFRENLPSVANQAVLSRISFVAVKSGEKASSEYSHSTGLPYWNDNGSILTYSENNLLKAVNHNEKEVSGYFTIIDNRLSSDNLLVNNIIGSLIKKKENYILNIAVSPDNENIAVEIASLGLFVVNTKNGKVYDFGNAEMPVWLNSSSLIVARVEDDGRSFINSDLFLINISSQEEVNITSEIPVLCFYPAADRNGNIYFVDEEGKAFRGSLSIE